MDIAMEGAAARKWRRGWDSNFRRFAGVRARSLNPGATGTTVILAERVGFEPTVRFPVRSLSRRVLSTAQSPLRGQEPYFSREVTRGAMPPSAQIAVKHLGFLREI